jgi:hypothetical protein
MLQTYTICNNFPYTEKQYEDMYRKKYELIVIDVEQSGALIE